MDAFVTDVLGCPHQGSKKELVGAKDITSLLSSYPTPAWQCQIFPFKWLYGFTQLNEPKNNCLAQFRFALHFCCGPEDGFICPKAQLVFVHYLITNVLSLQRWTNMARWPSPGILISVSIQRSSGESVMVEHSRTSYSNVPATFAVHRTCPKCQWDRSDELASPSSPEMMGKAGKGEPMLNRGAHCQVLSV